MTEAGRTDAKGCAGGQAGCRTASRPGPGESVQRGRLRCIPNSTECCESGHYIKQGTIGEAQGSRTGRTIRANTNARSEPLSICFRVFYRRGTCLASAPYSQALERLVKHMREKISKTRYPGFAGQLSISVVGDVGEAPFSALPPLFPVGLPKHAHTDPKNNGYLKVISPESP